jgi:hypothetical protein
MEQSVSIRIQKSVYDKLVKDAKKEFRTFTGQINVYQEFYHKHKGKK